MSAERPALFSSTWLEAVVAMAEGNRAIGREGKLPWHLPEDLKLFRQLTSGHPVIMGRKTFDSIGKPLPNRRNIVISRNQAWEPPAGIEVVRSIEALGDLSLGNERPSFVIGGAEIYQALMPSLQAVWASIVPASPEADAFMPAFEHLFPHKEEWPRDTFRLVRFSHREPFRLPWVAA